MKHHKQISADYIHSAFLAFEDSLISTTGVLAGIAVSTTNVKTIFTTGVVVIAVSSISLGASEFIGEETEEGVEKEKYPANPLVSSLITFFSFVIAGIVPLLPYLVFSKTMGITISVIAALLGLIILGVLKGKLIHKSPIRSAIEVFIIGGVAAAIGLAVGLVFKV